MLTKLFCATAALSWSLITPLVADDWVKTTSGGSTIEVPSSFLEGQVIVLNDDYGSIYRPSDTAISLRQYRVDSTDKPHAYLAETLGPMFDKITLSVDEDGLGVLAGHARDEFFYAICKRESGAVWCIDMAVEGAKKSKFAAIMDRIVASFIADTVGPR